MTLAYDKNTDYMAIMNAAKAKGDTATYIKAENSREEKLRDMNAAGTNTQGYTSTRVAPANFAGSTQTVGGVSPAAQKIIDQMNANSLKWYSDPASRQQLTANQQVLSQQLAALNETDGNGGVTTYAPSYNSAAGTWTVTPNYVAKPVTSNTNPNLSAPTPTLSGLELGDKYGITYDQPTIQKLLDDATKSQYLLKNQQAQQSENKFYGNMLDTQGTALDSLRKSQASAVATGASKGMAAANELSAILNLQQTSSDEATLLAQNRGNLSTEETAAYKQNASDSLNTSNTLKEAIAGLAGTKYGYDTQGYASQLSYLAALQDVAAQKYASDTTLTGVKYNADANVAAAQATASKYGTSGNTYSGGGNSNATATANPALSDLALKLAANGNNWVPDGQKYTISDNKDGNFTLTGVTDKDGKLSNITVNSDEMEKIKNNGYDPMAVMNTNYGTDSYKYKYDAAAVGAQGTKDWTKAQVTAYHQQYGVYPAGWTPGNGKETADINPDYAGATKENSYTITGAQGQKFSVGMGNYATTWTYDAKKGMWSNGSGGSQNMNDFKAYLKKQNQAYVKALN